MNCGIKKQLRHIREIFYRGVRYVILSLNIYSNINYFIMRIFLILCLISLMFIKTFSQVDNKVINIKIATPASGSTSKTIIENLVNNYGFLITYQSNDPVLDYPVQLPKTDSITVKELLDVLQNNLPYEFLFKNEYIILRKKDLPKKLELKGKVRSAENPNDPVIANIFIKEKRIGQSTDLHGEYMLKIPPGNYIVEFSCIGYKKVSRNINLYTNQELNILLEEVYYDIKQVEVTRNRKKVLEELDVGRNIERIESKTIKQINFNNPTDALQGRINGVWTTRVSGAPGDHQKVRIRGINSLFAAVDPLYVVNGVQVPVVNLSSLGIGDINSRDIESIIVLKDVSSTAYYGYQGGNGVVKIETKKGGGKNQIHFYSKIGIQNIKKKYPLMNSDEFLHTILNIDSVFPNRSKFPRHHTYGLEMMVITEFGFEKRWMDVNRFVYPYPYDTVEYISDDWQEEIFQTGLIQEYQLAFQGSKKKTKYYVSGNFYDHEGVVIHSNYRKYSYSANFSNSLFKNFSIDYSGFGSYQENTNNLDNYLGNKIIFQGINIEPEYNILSEAEKRDFQTYPYDPSTATPGFFDMYRKQEMYAFYSENMPDLYINNFPDARFFFALREQNLDVLSNNYSLGLKYQIHNNILISNRSSFSHKRYTYESTIRIDTSYEGAKHYQSIEKYRVLSNIFDVNYLKELSNNVFSFNASYRFYEDQVKWDVDSVQGFNLDEIDRTTDGYVRGSNAIYGKSSNIIRDINSLIFHAKFLFKNKYTISAFANIDRLKEGNFINAQEIFPSVAINWDISREYWMSSIQRLNELSVFANWGKVGNYPLNSLSNDIYSESKLFNGQDFEKTTYISNLANHGLKHEEAEEFNIGFKIKAFQNRLFFDANFYTKENRNLIINRDIPYYYGGGFGMINLGNMRHNGFELSVDANLVETSKFTWNTIFGYSFDKQRVTNIYQDHDTLFFHSDEILIPEFYIAKNAHLGDIVGYKYEGCWTEKDEEVQDPNFINHMGVKYYKVDTVNPELIEDDKVIIGNSIPDFTCHWINNFQYKNITMNMHWYAVLGVDKFNATRASTYYTHLNKEIKTFVQDTMSHFMDPVFYASSYFVEDASFIRLKTLSIIYTPKKELFKVVKAIFSLSFENILTITRYKGYDPEATVYTDNSFSDNALDIGAYPTPRSVFFGIDLTF